MDPLAWRPARAIAMFPDFSFLGRLKKRATQNCKIFTLVRSLYNRKSGGEIVRRSSLIFIVLALASVLVPAQDEPHLVSMTFPKHPDPPFATQLRKMVMVIESTCRVGTKSEKFEGTGFVVADQDPRLPKDTHFDYLVTNRHVAECWDDSGMPRQVLAVDLRANLSTGSSATDQLSPHGNVHWYFPADDSVDLAVTPIVLAPAIENLRVPLDMFFTKDSFTSYNVGEGAKIILSGYFVHIPGVKRVQPIIREGILAMIPDEPIETTTRKRGTVYLADTHIFGGNSGSPAFISTAGVRPGTVQFLDSYMFLGVVSGYYFEDSEISFKIATTVKGIQRANSGVSMVVPADFLKDLILNNRELAAVREAELAKMHLETAK
ncbi:MAG: hypothetical protein WCF42_02490 [Terriglobales bacterium]